MPKNEPDGWFPTLMVWLGKAEPTRMTQDHERLARFLAGKMRGLRFVLPQDRPARDLDELAKRHLRRFSREVVKGSNR